MFEADVKMATNVTTPSSEQIEPSALAVFGGWFTSIHGYSSLTVCFFGIPTNLINITVLSRKDMRNPTNALLCWLAVADLLTMIPYVPFVIHFYCAFDPYDSSPDKFTFPWAVYMLFLINFVATTHTISNWLGVSLAVFRFVQLRSTSKGTVAKRRLYSTIQKVIAGIYVCSCVVLVPNYMTNKIVEHHDNETNKTAFFIEDIKLGTNDTKPIVLVNVLTYSILTKIVPCILMTVFSGSLLISLNLNGRQRRRRLSVTSNKVRRESRQAKTTRMLLVVIILFLLTEFPHGLLILISTVIPDFYYSVYSPLGDLMDLLALVNNAINFLLYCIMSTQFRTKFLQMYFNKQSTFKDMERTQLTTSLKTTFTTI
ncbi:G-protein coupled receptor dmsr-1-like [Mya arenaria]|uniref:G-protein coupled receptor dmsr-1-like n=1 Tax=Mya arenaria TaxID=6604 RepID=UPI0022E1BC9B|nr:G-protein coupled receptor dmsr-1-like [Mya arenaria]